jgi:RNA polymerase sigma factor (sigma-70 family)
VQSAPLFTAEEKRNDDLHSSDRNFGPRRGRVTAFVESVVDSGSHPGEAGRFQVIDGDLPLDWESVYRDNVASIYRLLYYKVGNQHDAEDLTSQVFLEALPRLRANASGGEIHMYLVTTAKTMLADHWRRRLGVQVTTIDENLVVAESQGPPPDPLPRIRRILAKLPPNYRRVLELRFLERCSVGETAAKMGISAGNARVVQYRALQRAAELGQEVGA